MNVRTRPFHLAMVAVALFLVAGCGRSPAPPGPATAGTTGFTFGLLLVGPYNDHGWSQAQYAGGRYVEARMPGSKMLYIDKVNPSDRPGTTASQLAEDLLAKGARLIIFNSDDMKDEVLQFCRRHPQVPVVHVSGDSAWKDGRDYQGLPSLVNVMGRVEYAKAMAGFVAALTSRTGRIGYLGPLINDETRRLVAAVYLGARHAWTKYRRQPAATLQFKVTWIGFWFNIPGVTADPTQVADDFYQNGYDVVVSGLDTTENLVEASRLSTPARPVWAIQYAYPGACAEAPRVCLGSMYFNWGPSFLRYATAARDGQWQAAWEWLPPDWRNINDPDTSAIGFANGAALSPDVAAQLDRFVQELAGGLNLWTGPINFQDGSLFLKSGEAATDRQIWYLPQLLAGMEGQSMAGK